VAIVDYVEQPQARGRKPKLAIQEEMVDEGKDLQETTAGKTLLSELLEQESRFRADLAKLKAEYERTLQQMDDKHAAELQEQCVQLEASMQLAVDGQAKLLANLQQLSEQKLDEYADHMARLDSEIKSLEAKLRESASRPGLSEGGGEGPYYSDTVGGDMVAVSREHSRLVKAHYALGLFGVLAGVGLTIAGGKGEPVRIDTQRAGNFTAIPPSCQERRHPSS
jgi:hypothetical protein